MQRQFVWHALAPLRGQVVIAAKFGFKNGDDLDIINRALATIAVDGARYSAERQHMVGR